MAEISSLPASLTDCSLCLYSLRSSSNPVVAEISTKYQVSVPRLSIRYDYQLGLIPLPRSTNPVHIAENKNIDFVFSDADMKRLLQTGENSESGSLTS